MNYSDVQAIFDAGISNMTCLFKDSNSYDSGTYTVEGAEYATYRGDVITSIYAGGDSFIGINSNTEHLRVDRRDARMRSLYREEGTLYNRYKFLKVRWEGWSAYNQSGENYQLKYDVIFWESGDISLHMVSVPTSSYDGTFQFVADKTYTYTKPTSEMPDVTFKYVKESGSFEIAYEPIDMPPPYWVLIKDAGGTLYTLTTQTVNELISDREEVLQPLEEKELTAELFRTKGFAKLPDWQLLKDLDTPSVLSWCDVMPRPVAATVKGTPPPQYIESTANLSSETVIGIAALNADYSGDVKVQYSYDGEQYSEQEPITDFLATDLETLYAGLAESKTITFRFWLTGDATLTSFTMTYKNGGEENG